MRNYFIKNRIGSSRFVFDPADFLLLFSSFFALIMAYSAEFFMNLKPCVLCLYQRVPFFVVIFFVSLRFFTPYKKTLLFVCLLSLFCGAAIAFYQAGLEYKIFPDILKCSSLPNFDAIEDVESALIGKNSVLNIPRCDQPQITIFGISMAGMNFLYCTFIILLTFYLKFGHCERKKTK